MEEFVICDLKRILKDGEFVQITVEDEGRVTGFVSRTAMAKATRESFWTIISALAARRQPSKFRDETVHGVWFEFKGTVECGEGKNRGDEAYLRVEGDAYLRQ